MMNSTVYLHALVKTDCQLVSLCTARNQKNEEKLLEELKTKTVQAQQIQQQLCSQSLGVGSVFCYSVCCHLSNVNGHQAHWILITMLLSIWPLCVPLLSIAFPLISSNITCSWPGAIFLHRFQVMLQFGQYSALWQFVLPFDPYCRLCGYSCFSGLYCSTLAFCRNCVVIAYLSRITYCFHFVYEQLVCSWLEYLAAV